MKIFGHEYGFALTVGASAQISKLCPEGDLSRLGEVLSGSVFAETAEAGAAIVVAMANAYDQMQKFSGNAVEHPPLTTEMLFALPQNEYMAVLNSAMSAFGSDTAVTVEVEPSKKKGNNVG